MNTIIIDALEVVQPIGNFYIGVIDAEKLKEITYSDIRKLEDDTNRELDDYIGIQRPLSETRRKNIIKYISGMESTFPNSIIISVEKKNVEWDAKSKTFSILYSSDEEKSELAKILDGQHRISGFNDSNVNFINDDDEIKPFQLIVTIFVGSDISTQANIFATVNLAQTKVNRSLVYDLESLAKAPSPEKTCHDVAVLLNRDKGPFFRRIKRLGVATPNVTNELLTQASFVQNIIKLITPDATADRNYFLAKEKGGERAKQYVLLNDTIDDAYKYPFRAAFLNNKNSVIAKNINNFFSAVEKLWPIAWDKSNNESSLNRTIGFMALVRILKIILQKVIEIEGVDSDRVISIEDYYNMLDGGFLEDEKFENLDANSKSTKIIFDLIFDNLATDEDE